MKGISAHKVIIELKLVMAHPVSAKMACKSTMQNNFNIVRDLCIVDITSFSDAAVGIQ